VGRPSQLIFLDHKPLESVEIPANRIVTDGGISRAGIGQMSPPHHGRAFSFSRSLSRFA